MRTSIFSYTYFICISSLLSVAWVVVPQEELDADPKKYLEKYKKKIDDKLQELGVEAKMMVNVDAELPFEPPAPPPPRPSHALIGIPEKPGFLPIIDPINKPIQPIVTSPCSGIPEKLFFPDQVIGHVGMPGNKVVTE